MEPPSMHGFWGAQPPGMQGCLGGSAAPGPCGPFPGKVPWCASWGRLCLLHRRDVAISAHVGAMGIKHLAILVIWAWKE